MMIEDGGASINTKARLGVETETSDCILLGLPDTRGSGKHLPLLLSPT